MLLSTRKYFCSLPGCGPLMSTKYSALGQMENPEDITLLTFEISNTKTNSNGILLID